MTLLYEFIASFFTHEVYNYLKEKKVIEDMNTPNVVLCAGCGEPIDEDSVVTAAKSKKKVCSFKCWDKVEKPSFLASLLSLIRASKKIL